MKRLGITSMSQRHAVVLALHHRSRVKHVVLKLVAVVNRIVVVLSPQRTCTQEHQPSIALDEMLRSEDSDLKPHHKHEIDWILGDPQDTQLHATSSGARCTIIAGIGQEGPYCDLQMKPSPQHIEDTENSLNKER
jgi:hypothetical protein